MEHKASTHRARQAHAERGVRQAHAERGARQAHAERGEHVQSEVQGEHIQSRGWCRARFWQLQQNHATKVQAGTCIQDDGHVRS